MAKIGHKIDSEPSSNELSGSSGIGHSPAPAANRPTTTTSDDGGSFEKAAKAYANADVPHSRSEPSAPNRDLPLTAADRRAATNARLQPLQLRPAQQENNTRLQNVMNDPADGRITPAAQSLIQKHGLQFDRANEDWIYLKAPAHVDDQRVEAPNAEHWYRTMNQDQFDHLRKTGELPESDSFGGIATNRKYANGYMTNNGNATHTVEFHVPPPGRLAGLMDAQKIPIKAEGDGGTYGLGSTGTKPTTSGGKPPANVALNTFNEHVDPNFRVTDYRIPNRPDDKKPPIIPGPYGNH